MMYKYGIRNPKGVKEAEEVDHTNGNTLWWDAICHEMKNMRIVFEQFDGDDKDMQPSYQYVDSNIIFEFKDRENFRSKNIMVAGGHKITISCSLIYSLVVLRGCVRIFFNIAALNGLKVLLADIQSAYLTVNCREKIWTVAGPEFKLNMGKKMLIIRVLYGLKCFRAVFRSLLSETLYILGY